jgi:hypothetical protein
MDRSLFVDQTCRCVYKTRILTFFCGNVQRLINEGAVYIVVPGNPPTGCSPSVLTFRQSNDTANYDLIGCLRDVNRVVRYHNMLLRAAVGSLRDKYPHARIIFADFYQPIIQVLQNPSVFGKPHIFVVNDGMQSSTLFYSTPLPVTLRVLQAFVNDVLKSLFFQKKRKKKKQQRSLTCASSVWVFRTLKFCNVAGFGNDVLKACCGSGGGTYNWDPNAICAMPRVTACENPAAYVSWDGVHYTEAMNRHVAEGWLNGPYAQPPIKSAVLHY